jgi:hypothetical protein
MSFLLSPAHHVIQTANDFARSSFADVLVEQIIGAFKPAYIACVSRMMMREPFLRERP